MEHNFYFQNKERKMNSWGIYTKPMENWRGYREEENFVGTEEEGNI